MPNRVPTSLVSILLLVSTAANAQTTFDPPDYQAIDSRDVNLISGKSFFKQPLVSIGPDDLGLSLMVHSGSNTIVSPHRKHNFYGYVTNSVSSSIYNPKDVEVRIGETVESFLLQSGTYTNIKGNGTTLVQNANSTFTFTMRDGTRVTTGAPTGSTFFNAYVERMEYPTGREVRIHWRTGTNAQGNTVRRIQSVTQNNGYQIKFVYQSNSPTQTNWTVLTQVTALNNAVDYCAPTADSCSYSRSWPTATISSVDSGGTRTWTFTNPLGGQTRYQQATNFTLFSAVEGVRLPTSSSQNTSEYEYDDWIRCIPSPPGCTAVRRDLVSKVTTGGGVWTYTHNPAGPFYYESRSSGPDGSLTVLYSQNTGWLISLDNVDGTRARFANAAHNRLDEVIYPEGNSLEYEYDSRGNITVERLVRKPGSSLANIERRTGYPSSCSAPKTCNQPTWYRDGRGHQTDYVYHAASGQLAKETLPADANGVRPETRFDYTQKYARVKSASGSVTQVSPPIWLLTREAFCRTSATTATGCTAANDEVVITYDYGPQSGGTNNLLLRGKTVTAQGVSLRTCYSYDDLGNRISETLPRAGLSSCP